MKKGLLLTLLIASTTCAAQLTGWRLIKEVKLGQTPTAYSFDIENNLYVGFEYGSLIKYSKKGEEYPPFSLPNQSSMTLIEAQNNRKIFIFYRDIQEVRILDRFSAIPKVYPLRNFGVNYANSTCPTPDGDFWVIENNPQRLRKIAPLTNSIVHEIQHALGDSTFFMRTYQNLLLVGDEKGLHVLDQFGSLINSFDIGSTTYIQIINDEVVASADNQVFFVDPYQSIILDTLSNEPYQRMVFLTDHMALLKREMLMFYSKENAEE